MASRTRDGWAMGMRWSGRVLALLTVGLFLLFLFQAGDRVFPALSWTKPQGWPLAITLVGALLGLIAAWRWEAAGGAVAIMGSAAMVLLVVLGSGVDMLVPALIFVAPLVLASLMYLGCSARSRMAAHHGENGDEERCG